MVRPTVLLAALLVAVPAFASPTDSLSGTDMIAELRSRRAAFANSIIEGTVVLLSTPDRRLFGTRQEPNLFWLTGVEASRAALVVRVERPELPPDLRRARIVLDRMIRLRGDLAVLGSRRLRRQQNGTRHAPAGPDCYN